MIILVDSGSTKADWRIINNGSVEKSFATSGMNPLVLKGDEIRELILASEARETLAEAITTVYFYGAGCGSESRCKIVGDALLSIFSEAEINVNSDLLGCARSMYNKENGIACILGTGSNSCYYENNKIVNKLPSVGYVIGDEGSGNDIGRRLLRSYFNGSLSDDLCTAMQNTYNISLEEVLDKVYRTAGANKYLASFTGFVKRNIDDDEIFRIVNEAFESFFVNNILKYDNCYDVEIRFTGSVAYHFFDIIQSIGREKGVKIGSCVQYPIDGLVEYHS